MTRRADVAFLFLGETLLIPHLWPIVEALAEPAPDLAIDLWVSTSMHEALLGKWAAEMPAVRIRRAPGFRRLVGYEDGRNPPLPAKLPMLFRLAPQLARVEAVVSAEQTSLWLPALLPMRARFVNTTHGVAPMSARGGRRRAAAWRMLVPSAREQATYLERGFSADYVRVTGYVKAGFRHRSVTVPAFDAVRPVLLYNPHWQAHRSSWPVWGREIVERLCRQDRFNVILAPHQRTVEKAPELRAILTDAARHGHVHADIDSFACVDGSYTAAADLYLGDTSSQVTEYLIRPRPCVFLNQQGFDWGARDDLQAWRCGDVIDRLDDLDVALDRAFAAHESYVRAQRDYVEAWLGDASGAAAMRCAAHVLEAVGISPPAS